MKVVIQRAKNASVFVDGIVRGKIEKGFMILVGVTNDDTIEDVIYLVNKVSLLRVFEDQNGKMNLSLKDVNGEILSISQFTLYADTKHGNRPSFTLAAKPPLANSLYSLFNNKLKEKGYKVETGVFGADMDVSFTNDGPVTIIIDSKQK